MGNRFMITVATAALIAGTGLANAQGMGGGREGGAAGGAGMQQSAPSSPAASPSGGAAGHEGSAGMKSSQSEEKGGAPNRSAQQEKSGAMGGKSAQTGEKSQAQEKSAQDTKGDHSKSMSSQNEKGAPGKDMKTEGREERNGNRAAEGHQDRNNTVGAKEGERSQTTGQAGAGAKLSSEQRTRITTVIRGEHVAPVTNINFAVSIGTRVPREVGFHPLPAEIVTIYPDWRGYEFFLARDEIVVVDPRTLEIIAVLPA
jgi:hypothetical protein